MHLAVADEVPIGTYLAVCPRGGKRCRGEPRKSKKIVSDLRLTVDPRNFFYFSDTAAARSDRYGRGRDVAGQADLVGPSLSMFLFYMWSRGRHGWPRAKTEMASYGTVS